MLALLLFIAMKTGTAPFNKGQISLTYTSHFPNVWPFNLYPSVIITPVNWSQIIDYGIYAKEVTLPCCCDSFCAYVNSWDIAISQVIPLPFALYDVTI